MPSYDIERSLIRYVREGLKKKTWTQHQLADAVGTTTKHVTMVLNGRSRASIQMWQRLVDAAWADVEEDTQPKE